MAKRAAASTQADPELDEGVDTGRLDSLIGFHLRMAHVAVWRDFCASLEPVGLTQKQLAVLFIIRTNPGVSQIDMANAISTDRATMMALVDRLQDRALVVRRVSPQDRRRQAIYLTPLGEKTLTQAEKLAHAHEARLFAGFTPQEAAQLIDMLKRLKGS